MNSRRGLAAPAVIGVIALMAAACTPDDDEEAVTEFEEGPLGAVTIGPEDPIKFGVIQAISGDTASLGTDEVRAVEIAIEEQGELVGHPIEHQVEDEQCRAEGGTASAQRLIADPQIVGVIGTSCSGAAVPAMEILAEQNIVMISGSNTSPTLTSDLEGNQNPGNHEGYYRTAHNDIIQGQAAAEFAFTELGATSAATIHDGDPYTEGLATAFGTSFTELGGEVVLATAISKGDTDMRPVLTEVAAAEPDIVFFPIFQPEADFIVQQAKDFPSLADTEKMMGADGLLSDTFIVLAQTEGMYFSGPATPEGSVYEDFVATYQEEFGEAPIQAFHAHAYDATNMLFAAIEEVAFEEDDGTVRIDRQQLMDALYATEGFEGLTGTLTCDEFGDCADPVIDIVQNTEAETTIDQVRGNVLATFEP